MKFDPKLLKKVNQSTLIQASKLVGIKNAEKVAKESLIPAFIKAVEAVPENEQENLDAVVINTYNEIVKTLGLDQEAPTPPVPVTTKTITKTTKAPIVAKAKKTPPPKKDKYSRIQAFCDAVKSKKSGKIEALIELSNQKYVGKGGNDNAKEAATVANMGIRFLEGMEIVSMEDGNFKLI